MLDTTTEPYTIEEESARREPLRTIPKLTKNDVTVILPVLNEEKGVGLVIDELQRNGYPNILVVDGYSKDMTVQVARSKEVTVIQQHGRGKTGAIRTAIEQASTPYLLVMDGDHTYNPQDIEKFLAHANGYDQIVGARDSKNISMLHRLGNWILSAFFNALMGTHISDVCSGMYLLNSKSARHLRFHTNGFSVEVEVLAQMVRDGRITEVPISYRDRIGTAKLSTWMHGFMILESIFGLARVNNPVLLFSLIAGSAAIPGFGILAWSVLEWLRTGIFPGGWALWGGMLLLLSSQAFIVGTISLLIRRSEMRIERIIRIEHEHLQPKLS
jgi:dolichol-phosphate mannosyltransferase